MLNIKGKKFVTQDDVKAATELYANVMPGKKDIDSEKGVIKIPTEDGKGAPNEVRLMDDMEITNALRTESIKYCFTIELARHDVTLSQLAKIAKEGLEAWKYTNVKDEDGRPLVAPDFEVRHRYWNSLMKVLGAYDNPYDPLKTQVGEKVIDVNTLTDEQLEAAIKAEIADIAED